LKKTLSKVSIKTSGWMARTNDFPKLVIHDLKIALNTGSRTNWNGLEDIEDIMSMMVSKMISKI